MTTPDTGAGPDPDAPKPGDTGPALYSAASIARTMAADARALDNLLRTAVAAAGPALPHPDRRIRGSFPATARPAALADDLDAWADTLTGLADTAEQILPAAATHLLDHLGRFRGHAEQDREWLAGKTPDEQIESTMRNGLGGIAGDYAAAFNHSVALQLVALFTAVHADATPDQIRGIVNGMARAYLDARRRDDERR